MAIKDYKDMIKSAKTHQAKLDVLVEILNKEFKIDRRELIENIEVGMNALHRRGRADLLFSDIIFEVKTSIKKELESAREQLKKYMQSIYEKEKRKCVGIATDLETFVIYRPVIRNDKVELREVNRIKIEDKNIDTVLSILLNVEKKIFPTADDLKMSCGLHSVIFGNVFEELEKLYKTIEKEIEIKLKYELWSRNMELVYGKKPDVETFIKHTYLVSLVKIIIFLYLNDGKYNNESLSEVLSGKYFEKRGIVNLIEEDFFSWILHQKIEAKAVEVFKGLLRVVQERYDFAKISEDFFKEIYQDIVERKVRHQTGEYYTPDWVAQYVSKKAIEYWHEFNRDRKNDIPKILDPACGSGTFLCTAIHEIRKILEKNEKYKGITDAEKLEKILENVCGIDLNPLSVIIARANYLMALGNLRSARTKNIIIPVFMADSIKDIEKSVEFAKESYTDVCKYNVCDEEILKIPFSMLQDRELLNAVLYYMKNIAKEYRLNRIEAGNQLLKKKDEYLQIFDKKISKIEEEQGKKINVDDKFVMLETLKKILDLVDLGKDSIWTFMISNIYAPISLMKRFDIIVGNPPWVVLKSIENYDYQNMVKKIAFDYHLIPKNKTNLFTCLELATVFFCVCSDRYQNDDGIIAFVMPHSVLSDAGQHENFKKFAKPAMTLLNIADLKLVDPLFTIPSCVLFAKKGGKTEYPVNLEIYSGKLPEKNCTLNKAIEFLQIEKSKYSPPQLSASNSYYYNKFKEGAIMAPRCFFFVKIDAHDKFGINSEAPLLKTDDTIKFKEPWDSIIINENVEKEFIYSTLLSREMVPFGYLKMNMIVLPILPDNERYKILDIEELKREDYSQMANWLSKSQKEWEKHCSERFKRDVKRLINQINFYGSLTKQNPRKRYVVLYNKSGTKLVSCVIDKHMLQKFKIDSIEIPNNGFIADFTTYVYETNDEDEAYYLCGVLNSNYISEIIKPGGSRGQWNIRDFHKRALKLPIPKFDGQNKIHVEIAKISKECSSKIAHLIKEMKMKIDRNEVWEMIKDEISRIDKLVRNMLESAVGNMI